ncbi:AGE family epimerase/isomerase [Sphingomonas sp.]|uniref:AGE family epimerase/isomerase n=1 Tax=Sphingomonas sp. TaxID=28214 RepID=UPI000DB364AE|nr:AGE family epimerase/isomerase [Sphingomonas sp.]PZU10301.1 MAG: N-acylglucosamine 2-epimerase [Sphingomonas sp.]
MIAGATSGALASYIRWVGDSALPFWSEQGFDSARGRFRERLDREGRPIDVPHRAMVQARQAYVFAHAAKLGWFPEGGRLAEIAMANLVRDYGEVGLGTASFHFSVDGNGLPAATHRDAYTHAFLLFALAWLYALTGDRRHLNLADKIIAFIDAKLLDPDHGGLFDAAPAGDLYKRQNPLMHLLEAYLFLAEAAPDKPYFDRASELVALFKAKLFMPSDGVLLEHFAQDWGPHPDPAKASLFEPGHHFEWVWLLDRYARLAKVPEEPAAAVLYRVACAHGAAGDGLIYDEVRADKVPVKLSHRVWPHTEAIKAAIVRHEAGDDEAFTLAESMANQLLGTFLNRPFTGGWIDHVSETGVPLVDYVPASSLYHLFLAATEARRLATVPRTTPQAMV